MKVMKVIHDLKNPILSIKQIINESENDDLCSQAQDNMKKISPSFNPVPENPRARRLSNAVQQINLSNLQLRQIRLEPTFSMMSHNSDSITPRHHDNAYRTLLELRRNVNCELEDVEEMLENLRTEFKSNQAMQFREELLPTESTEFLVSFQYAHARLAESGRNKLLLQVSSGFPVTIEVQKSLLKRIINNFISNSLKHTVDGTVEVEFMLYHFGQMTFTNTWVHVGAELAFADFYICICVSDDGKGIPPEKLATIFSEKESDESAANWDGCGLGLPICEKLSKAIGASIFYTSEQNVATKFMLCMPLKLHLEQEEGPNVNFQEQMQRVENVFKSCDNTVSIMHTHDPEIRKPVGMSIALLDKNFTLELNFHKKEVSEAHDHLCNCIYIAEDSVSISKRYEAYLSKNKINYLLFSNGQEALKYIEKELNFNCKSCKKYLLVTDMHMPYMNGLELTRKIREIDLYNKMEVYLLSADDYNASSNQISQFDYYFTKPIQMSSFKTWSEYLMNMNKFDKKIVPIKSASIEMNNDNLYQTYQSVKNGNHDDKISKKPEFNNYNKKQETISELNRFDSYKENNYKTSFNFEDKKYELNRDVIEELNSNRSIKSYSGGGLINDTALGNSDKFELSEIDKRYTQE